MMTLLSRHVLTSITGLEPVVLTEILELSLPQYAFSVLYDLSDFHHARRRMPTKKS